MRLLVFLPLLLLLASAAASDSAASGDALLELLAEFDERQIPSGILYDRALPLSRLEDHDGQAFSPPVTAARWRQMAHEIRRSSLRPPAWSLEGLRAEADDLVREGVVPIAVLNFRYHRIRPEALADGSLRLSGRRLVATGGDPFRESRLLAAAALRDETRRGERVVFALDRERYLTNDPREVRSLEIDLDDGLGFRAARFGDRLPARYDRRGPKEIRLLLRFADDTTLRGGFRFSVKQLGTPLPHDTLSVTATIPYAGEVATGEAYVYLSDANPTLTNPILVIEGFDLDDTYDWEQLYELLNQENLIETLRALGYDAVVLNFTEATTYIQRNAFLVVELIQQVEAITGPASPVVIGASMGGLVGRYALSWMESQGIDHRVRTFISFDAPQAGADIPLGIQYWLDFFKDQSADAAFLLSRLDTPAARQMLVYHHTVPPGATGEPDPLRTDLLADLATVGDWPQDPRRVAIANGSGTQADQGFAPGDQIISWEYGSLLVDIIGNVWAVPDGSSQTIFDGEIDIVLLPPETQTVTVSGTLPYDGAPGGFRASMAEMDSTEAPFGDIVALHDAHGFIPTISALALATSDLFYDVAGDPDPLALSPFDALYFPTSNQEHVSITPESANWFVSEIVSAATSADPRVRAPTRLALHSTAPNPFRTATTIAFSLAERSRVSLDVFDVQGRLVRRLLRDELRGAGRHTVAWDGTGRGSSGVFFIRLTVPGRSETRRMIRVR